MSPWGMWQSKSQCLNMKAVNKHFSHYFSRLVGNSLLQLPYSFFYSLSHKCYHIGRNLRSESHTSNIIHIFLAREHSGSYTEFALIFVFLFNVSQLNNDMNNRIFYISLRKPQLTNLSFYLWFCKLTNKSRAGLSRP